MSAGPVQDPRAYQQRYYWWLIGFTFLLVGIVFFLIFAVTAFNGIINCGLRCGDKNIIDIFFGGFEYFGTCCLSLILFIIGAVILAIFRWGMFIDGRYWRRPYQRNRHP